MNGPYFIETLARNGDVLHRHRVNSLPIRLGRGYDNDFIVDDAYAAPRHAVIEADEQGQLVLRDLGTKNGVVHRGVRKNTVVLTGDTAVRMGHTSLRVRCAAFPVPQELLDRTMHGWEGGLPGLIGILLIGVVALLMTWLADTKSFQLIRYVQALAVAVGVGLAWGGVWAFANRLFGRQARLGRHLFIFGCALAAITLYKVCSTVAAYAFSLEWLTRYGSHAVILAAAGMLYFHLSTVKPHNARRFAVTCAILGLLGAGLNVISNIQSNGRPGDELYMAVLMPPAVKVAPDQRIDQFMGQVAAMKAKVDGERGKKEKDDGSEGDDDD